METGHPQATTHGLTTGFNLQVSDEAEKQFSGKPIIIRVVGRSTTEKPTRFAIAYSTNEVGNSGWIWRELSSEWARVAFVYDVPKMKVGNGDFLGLLPAPAGEGAVEIAAVAVVVAS